MNLTQAIDRLLSYGLNEKLIEPCDVIYARNQLFDLYKVSEPEEGFEVFKQTVENEDTFEEILEVLLDKAYEFKLIEENTVTYRDLFDSRIMNILMPRPSEVQKTFSSLYKEDPEKATDYYYNLSRSSNYIKKYRIKKDMKWTTETEYGKLDITINLSKPEKDPKAIAAAKNQKQSGYPKCLLCPENEGYAGRVNHPSRNNHRIIPLKLNGEDWFVQYSPYVYYNEHCIVFNAKHTPMVINDETICKLLDFVKAFPHYLLGSNADLPIVGGSILTHEHFQGGRYVFPLNKAPALKEYKISGFDKVRCEIVKWPMSVVRLTSNDEKELKALASKILKSWRNYTDKEAFIFAETDGTPHNTITPIVSTKDGKIVLDLVLRNNITTDEHPLGVYHPHANLHHIKKENIGLIEVMGLAVLPSRLKNEMELLKDFILNKKDISSDERIKSHAEWVLEFSKNYKEINESNIDEILQSEIGKVFLEVLKDAGVYKQTEDGIAAFDRFMKTL